MTTILIDGKVVRPAASLPPKRIAHASPSLPEVVERFDDEAWQMWDEAVDSQDGVTLREPSPL